MLDTMIGKVGEVELASVDISNQYYFLSSLLTNKIAIGSGVLMALGLLMPQKIMLVFTKDSDVVKIGVQYLQIAIISYFFTTIIFSLPKSI